MTKIDFKKTLDSYHAKHGVFRVVDIPAMQYLMIDGHGDPNTSREFIDAVEALYPIAYKLKFMSKNDLGQDYVVPPLEGLWWADDMTTFTSARDKSQWDWTMMVMTPDWITPDMMERARQTAKDKGASSHVDKVRLQTLREGTCVQTLHIGSFDDETPVLEKLHHEIIPDAGYGLTGKHHEIYLSDFRRVAPDKQRTILRQPVTK